MSSRCENSRAAGSAKIALAKRIRQVSLCLTLAYQLKSFITRHPIDYRMTWSWQTRVRRSDEMKDKYQRCGSGSTMGRRAFLALSATGAAGALMMRPALFGKTSGTVRATAVELSKFTEQLP